MLSLSRTTWSRRGVHMVLDTAKLKNWKSTISPSTRGRDAAKELSLEMNITKVFTIVFWETKTVVNRNSKIGWTEQKCIEMDELAQQDHTYHLSKEEFKRYQGQWYLTLNKSGKNAPTRLQPDFRAAVSLKKPSPSWIRWRSRRTHFSSTISEMARWMNLRVCKHLDTSRWHTQGRRMNYHPGVVPSSRRGKKPPVRRKGGRAGLPERESGRHVVRGRQCSPIPAQTSRVSVAERSAPL